MVTVTTVIIPSLTTLIFLLFFPEICFLPFSFVLFFVSSLFFPDFWFLSSPHPLSLIHTARTYDTAITICTEGLSINKESKKLMVEFHLRRARVHKLIAKSHIAKAQAAASSSSSSGKTSVSSLEAHFSYNSFFLFASYLTCFCFSYYLYYLLLAFLSSRHLHSSFPFTPSSPLFLPSLLSPIISSSYHLIIYLLTPTPFFPLPSPLSHR